MGQGYSFIVPAFNDAGGLRRHLAYFSARPDPIQLVVVDDCSTDDTAEVMATAEVPENVEITYHRMDVNAGPAAARNKGLELALRDYVMFLDADDLLVPRFFDYIRLSPIANGEVDFVFFKHHLATEDEAPYSYNMHAPDRRFFSRRVGGVPYPIFKLDERPGAPGTVNFPWNKLYRRDFLLESGIRFPNLRMHEDIAPHWQSFLRCRHFGVLYWAPPLITHFETPGGSRATNYVGTERLGVFDELRRLRHEIVEHPAARHLMPVFDSFRGDLFSWLTGPLCDAASEEGEMWRQKYQAEIDALREEEAQDALSGNEAAWKAPHTAATEGQA
ncbi:MAG: glycosyltransferase family 2 protein [Paracoccaceae bacterium]